MRGMEGYWVQPGCQARLGRRCYARLEILSRSSACCWREVGVVVMVKVAEPTVTLLRAMVRRSCNRVSKLWTGVPSVVRLVRAFRSD